MKIKDNEHPLEHQQLFIEFQHMFEDIMSAFITNEGFTIQQFYEEVQRELEALPEGSDENATFASVLFSALDFTTFCEMMNDVRVEALLYFPFFPSGVSSCERFGVRKSSSDQRPD